MESIVIGTAGHIDHGKTALVKALTGFDTDTLEEEKRRGITINLGFAYFTLPCGKVAGIVDVPGHERFIKNMLAGAGGIDIAMVVIAANEGVMPQTREHIDILGYMDIETSIVVLTKTDMVDDEFKELLLEDTRKYLQTTFLRGAPVFEVDSLSGRGIPELVAHIDHIAQQSRTRKRGGEARMSVDRVFSVKGFGTVVTGTLSDGRIRLDDDLTVYPGEVPAKVRTLQIHERDVEEAHAGQRTAINLAGVTKEQVSRGSVVAKRDSVFVTKVLDVYLQMTRSTKVKLKKMFECKMYIGTRELVVKAIPLDCREVGAGGEAYGQILLEQEAALRRGDSFVLRTISPVETIGGGKVLDPAVARYRRVDEDLLSAIRSKHTGTPLAIVEVFIQAHPFQTEGQLRRLIQADSIAGELEALLQQGRVILLGGTYLHRSLLDSVTQTLLHILAGYHEEYPLRAGMSKAELLSNRLWPFQEREFEWLLMMLEAEQLVRIRQGMVRRYDFAPTLSSQNQALIDAVEEQLEQAGYTLLTTQEIVGDSGQKRQVLEAMLQDRLVLLGGRFVISRARYQQAIDIARELGAQRGAVRLSDFRDRLATSRKYALLLLERFDKEKLTKRTGEDRVFL